MTPNFSVAFYVGHMYDLSTITHSVTLNAVQKVVLVPGDISFWRFHEKVLMKFILGTFSSIDHRRTRIVKTNPPFLPHFKAGTSGIEL
jgi:hypothetical protein